MALFYRNRPDDLADATELIIAEHLEKLDDEWRVVWGYYFTDAKHIQREGDFLIQGPGGHILVMEVKGGANRQFVLTGEWEGNRDGDNPLEQLAKQWTWAIETARKKAHPETPPFVGSALCMPNINLTGEERLTPQFGEAKLIRRADLENFPEWWKTHMAKSKTSCPNPTRVFTQSFVPGKQPAPANLFIKETDRILDRFRDLNLDYLEMLEGNDRWVVEGGPGTGKTFLAVQRAKQLAEQDRKVLFLCYNLILADQLTQLVGKLNPSAGSITVKTWQMVVEEIIAMEGIAMEIPDDPAARTQYYAEELPGYVCEILKERPPEQPFDALVVDEAQDHDTAFSAQVEADQATGLGWWSWYFALLRDPQTAPISLFLDVHQRPAFRAAERFDITRLRGHLGNHAHFRLNTVRRYTSKLDAHLRSLPREATEPYPRLRLPEPTLPTGPDVLEIVARPENTADAIGRILKEWIGKKLCKIDDIVILGSRRERSATTIGEMDAINGYSLCDYAVDAPRGHLRYLGIHRAKGLDFLGVILIDIPVDKPESASLHFAGATRSRQLLACIRTPSA